MVLENWRLTAYAELSTEVAQLKFDDVRFHHARMGVIEAMMPWGDEFRAAFEKEHTPQLEEEVKEVLDAAFLAQRLHPGQEFTGADLMYWRHTTTPSERSQAKELHDRSRKLYGQR